MNVEPAISLIRVNKTFENGTLALKDLNLNIYQSEFISLVGPSGCGKSSLLRIIAGLSSASSGKIQWSNNANQKEIAFVFQEAALMPWATVMDNIRLPLKLAGVSKKTADYAVKESLDLVGLSDFEQAYPRQLSGGMKMRVSIARALVTSPKVLLMDEPFGALDDITRTKLNDELLALWSHKSWTVVFVTHNIYEAVYLSNRVIVMAARPGRVVADITIDEPLPRNEEFRDSQAYSAYCRKVATELSKAMN
jgi:NitT/TauT family transport system ATP-binding protein